MSEAFAPFEAEYVKELCENQLEELLEKHNKKMKTLIAGYITNYNLYYNSRGIISCLFWKMFKYKKLTEDQILEQNVKSYDHQSFSEYYTKRKSQIQAVLDLALESISTDEPATDGGENLIYITKSELQAIKRPYINMRPIFYCYWNCNELID